MPCIGISCAQGRQPCATPHDCGLTPPPRSCDSLGVCKGLTPPCAGCSQPALHQHNSDGTHRDDATTRHELDDTTPTPLPWEWVDDLRDFALLAPIAAALVGVAAMALGALVAWVAKG